MSNRFHLRSALIVCVLAALFTAGLGAGTAFAQSPWWHVTSWAVPSVLNPEAEQSEVLLVTVKASGGEVLWAQSREEFAVFPYDAQDVEVQAALEGLYGLGNVEVSGGPVEVAGELELEPYIVTIKGRAVPYHTVENLAPSACKLDDAPGCEPLEGTMSVVQATEGRAAGELVVTATNLGDVVADGGGPEPITVSDAVPAGFEAVGIGGEAFEGTPEHVSGLTCSLRGENGVSAPACSFEGNVHPFTTVTVHLLVDATSGGGGESDTASVSGGGARGRSTSRPLAVGSSTPFGMADYELVNEDEGGAPDTQAGSHPFQQTTTVAINQVVNEANGFIEPAVLPKDLHFTWPAGLIGDPVSLPQCPLTEFLPAGECPADTAVGVAKTLVALNQGAGPNPFVADAPLFNLVPSPGEPARFGFLVGGVPVYVDPSVRSGRDYGITVNVENISQLVGFRASEVTVWGEPGASVHDSFRGVECLGDVVSGKSCVPGKIENPTAFLSLPTSCTTPQVSTVTGDSWVAREPLGSQPLLAQEQLPALDGCDALPFSPEIAVTPDGHEASTPTGLNVDVHIPQRETTVPGGLAEAEPRSIAVALPPGVAVNPSSGDGLQACSEGHVGYTGIDEELNPGAKTLTFTPFLPGSLAARTAVENGEAPSEELAFEPGSNFCSNAAKVGEVTIKTPVLPPTQPLKGAVYIARQNENPFGSLLAMYMVAEDSVSGTLVKLAGHVRACLAKGETVANEDGEAIPGMTCQAPGQLITTFENSPQAPFEDAEIHFFGGERAPLASPAYCGAYTTTAAFTPWAAQPGEPAHVAYSTFEVNEGPHHRPCPGQSLPFNPSLTGGTTNVDAGAFSALSTSIGREDGEQNISRVTLDFPPGFSGLLSKVTLCPEAQANEGKCPESSLIGETTVSAGVGSDPVAVKGGKVYITEKYHGAPFGLSIVNPVKAGPFDLEHDTSNPSQDPPCDCLVVRAKVEVNRETAALTVTTNSESEGYAIPHLIDGIPVQIKKVNVTVGANDGFTFNPTSCEKMKIEGSIESDEGASKAVSEPFQVTNCAALRFEPKVEAFVDGQVSKENGTSLTLKISKPAVQGEQADLRRFKVELPKQLPSRLTTLQKACTSAQFEANPSGCPAASVIGHMRALTPLLPVPVEGPMYFVSHGGEAFPSLEIVLQGDGVTVVLVGQTDIKNGITSSTFTAIPDVPFTFAEPSLHNGPYSALTGLGNLCADSLTIPTELVAQSGGNPIVTATPVTVEHCPPALTVVSHKVTGDTATIEVKVPAAGRLVASAKGLSKASKKAAKAGALTLKLHLTGGEAAFLSKHRSRKLKARIELRFTPKKGSRLKTSVTVSIG